MLPKEKTKLDGQNCYLLGENKLGYRLIYLVETPYEYELIYKNKDGYISEASPSKTSLDSASITGLVFQLRPCY